MDSKSTSDAREKLLETTEDLIYRNGIQATGMDFLVKESGVSRKTIYKYFGTKDELVAEVLRRRDERWMNWFMTSVERAETPEARLLEIFSVLKGWFLAEGFRGCAFINTAGETGDPQDPVRLVAKEHKEKLLEFVRTICQEYGAPDPDALARRFLVLIDGAITVAHVLGDSSSADDALEVARTLLGK
ncbi:TetR/AcrR family transcriptional regulator [Metapseudomonas resinovorans]|uniref:Putative TetR family transcriptional regulator n=1 Tax=Metapseudomonas resinovorans NBRC 106553 TaxID=1245471 RepID=S6BGZ3_METRE|nr:TetR/AcrR family transcriptional regulator [Pseudomonas resinovorans]BAN48394.1 putative TetR family transcriptional regulator [Pseudomonas resinovorans NBRC 106553]